MPTDATAPESGPLSIDQAVSHLDKLDEQAEAPAETEQPAKPNTEAEPAAETDSEAETPIADDNAETEDGDAEAQAELPAIEPPRFWDAEQKKWFGELPRDKQEYLLSKETERDKAVSKKIEEAALSRKAADAEASRITQLNGTLDKLLPEALETFKFRWDGVDWNAVVDQYGAGEALKLRNNFEREQGVIQQLQAAKANAEQVQFTRYVEAEVAKLPELCPDLVDPKHGQERKVELGKFLSSAGVPSEAIRRMSALETSVAYDAMRWRNAQADAKAKASDPKTITKPAVPARPSVKPTAAPARPGSPQHARLQQLNKKAHLTMDEAVERMGLMEET